MVHSRSLLSPLTFNTSVAASRKTRAAAVYTHTLHKPSSILLSTVIIVVLVVTVVSREELE